MQMKAQSRVALAPVFVLMIGLGGGPSAGGQFQEYPSAVFEGGLDAGERAAAARPRRLEALHPIEVAIELTRLEGEVPHKSERHFGAPLKIGIDRELPPAVKLEMGARDLVWEAARGGGEVAAFSLTSPAAKALRLAIDFHRLPRGAEVRFYSPLDAVAAGGPFEAEFLRREAKASRRDGPFWSPVVRGETIAVEIWVPGWKRASDVRFSLLRVSHIYQSLETKDLDHIGRGAGCHRDLQCSKKWTTAGNGIAKIFYQIPGGTALCTGQLMANPDGDFLFLTAAHCISTRKEAKSATFFWFFERAACKGPDPTAVTQTGGGGKLLFTTLKGSTYWDTDHTLLKLKRTPPDGVTFLGWTVKAGGIEGAGPEENVGEKITCVHHPRGDLKTVTEGTVEETFRLLEDNDTLLPDGIPTHYQSSWKRRRGPTEGGSSGSAIMIGRSFPRQFVIGVLTGGKSTCADPEDADFFGIFQETMRRFKKFSKHFE